jgi:hypothetical protein
MRRLIILLFFVISSITVAEERKGAVLEIGLRSSYFQLHDSVRGGDDHFLGSLDELKERQNYTPLPFINVRFGPYFAVGLGYESLRVRTWSRPEPGGEIGHSDGTLDASGPALSVQGYLPTDTRYTPFAEASVLIFNTYFDHLSDWRNARGDENSHIIDVDDQNGFRLGLGCEFAIDDHWQAVAMLERTFLEADVTYYLYDMVADKVTIPLDHTSFIVGLKYRL